MKRPIIDYTKHGIPRCAIGGGTTKTRLTSRERRYLLRAAQREWARATVTWVREPYDRDSVWAHVDGVARGRVRRSDGRWIGLSDYTTGPLRSFDGSQEGARWRVERAICRALGAA